MWLIVGLGNPGKTYVSTRHNVGFGAIESSKQHFAYDKHSDALVAKQGDTLLCAPQTFMNNSGVAVSALMRYYHIPLDHCVAIYDDTDIPFGVIRVRSSGSDAGHNGMKSIIASIGSTAFPRVRIGVGPVPQYMDTADFVLARFHALETPLLPQIYAAAFKAAQDIVAQGGITPQQHYDITL